MSRIESARSGVYRLSLPRKLAIALVVCVGAFALVAFASRTCCAPPPRRFDMVQAMSRPADFALDLTGRTGTVAPRYFYRYRLQVGPDHVAHYTFSPGYEESGPSWTSEFRVSDAAIDSLWTEFQVGTLARTPVAPEIAPGEQSVGGGSESLVVVASGTSTMHETERRDAWAARIIAFIEHVGRLTPDSVQTRLRARHQAWANEKFGVQKR